MSDRELEREEATRVLAAAISGSTKREMSWSIQHFAAAYIQALWEEGYVLCRSECSDLKDRPLQAIELNNE